MSGSGRVCGTSCPASPAGARECPSSPMALSSAARALLRTTSGGSMDTGSSESGAERMRDVRRAFVFHVLLCQWVDQHLVHFAPCRSVHGAFADGLRLHALACLLTGAPRDTAAPCPQPQTRAERVRNIAAALHVVEAFLQTPLDGFQPELVADGNADMVVAILSVLVIEFDAASDLAVIASQNPLNTLKKVVGGKRLSIHVAPSRRTEQRTTDAAPLVPGSEMCTTDPQILENVVRAEHKRRSNAFTRSNVPTTQLARSLAASTPSAAASPQPSSGGAGTAVAAAAAAGRGARTGMSYSDSEDAQHSASDDSDDDDDGDDEEKKHKHHRHTHKHEKKQRTRTPVSLTFTPVKTPESQQQQQQQQQRQQEEEEEEHNPAALKPKAFQLAATAPVQRQPRLGQLQPRLGQPCITGSGSGNSGRLLSRPLVRQDNAKNLGGLLNRSPAAQKPFAMARKVVQKRRNDSAKGLYAIPADFAPHAAEAIDYNISCNAFTAIPDELLASTTLESLDISANRIRVLPPLVDAAGEHVAFTALATLRLSLNKLKSVPPEVFALPQLQEISLHHCGLDEIVFPEEGTLAESCLRVIDLESNSLAVLPSVASFPRLFSLKVSFNHLTALPPLDAQTRLAELSAVGNQIARVPLLPASLTSVDLSDNQIAALEEAPMFAEGAPAFKLTTLRLQKNQIRALPPRFFDKMPGLVMADLSENELHEIPRLCSDTLESLYLGGNHLTEMPVALNDLPALAVLDLSRNDIVQLPPLDETHGLRTLFLSFNPLREAPRTVPTRVKELHLAGCRLTAVPPYHLRSPEIVVLHSNQLESLDVAGLCSDTAQLRLLDVSLNCLTKDLRSGLAGSVSPEVEIRDQHQQGQAGERGQQQRVGVADMVGRRPQMEDFVAVADDVRGDGTHALQFYGLFDGHGGREVAKQGGEFVQQYISEHSGALSDPVACEQTLVAALVQANKLFPVTPLDQCQGSTALLAVVVGETRLHIANIGDSRAVLFSRGRVTRVSLDHKPLDPAEYQRILNVSGWVSPDGRIMGVLSVARALGDKALFPFVSSQPFTAAFELEALADGAAPGEQFLVLACDGVWDVVSDSQACTVVRESLQQHGGNTAVAAAALRDWAYINGSNDNISVIVVSLPGHL